MSVSTPSLPFLSSNPTLAPSDIPLLSKYSISIASFIISHALYIIHRVYVNKHARLDYESTHRSQVFVSLLHCILSAILSLFYVSHFPVSLDSYAPLIVTNTNYPIDYFRRFTLQMTLGYMIYDLLAYFYNFIGLKHPKRGFNVTETSISLLHHVIIIAAYATSLHNHVASFPEIALMTAEVSTPFLHLRYFMRESPYWRNSVWYQLIQIIFVIVFFVSRIIYGSFIVFATYYALFTIDSNVSLGMKTYLTSCCTLFVLVQYVWFYKIMSILVAKVRRGAESGRRKQKGVNEKKEK